MATCPGRHGVGQRARPARGLPTSTTGADGRTAADPLGAMVDTIYDDNGQVIGTQHSGDMRWTCMIYDIRGRVTDVTNRNANLVHTHYYLPGQGADVTCGGIIAHEAVHARQWSQGGMFFALLYSAEFGLHGKGCSNRYERSAYIEAGPGGC